MAKGGGFVLSKNSVKLLKWMNENGEWMYYRHIEKIVRSLNTETSWR